MQCGGLSSDPREHELPAARLRWFLNKRDCLVVDLVGATERFDLLTLPKLFNLGDAKTLEGRTVTEALAHEAAAPIEPQAPIVAEEVDLFRDRAKLSWVAVGERWTLPTGRGFLMLEPYGGLWRVIVQVQGSQQPQVLGQGT